MIIVLALSVLFLVAASIVVFQNADKMPPVIVGVAQAVIIMFALSTIALVNKYLEHNPIW